MATLLAALAISLAVAACNGGGNAPADITPKATPSPTVAPGPTPTPEPSSTPTPVAESGGMEGFRDFATLIDHAVAESNGDFFAQRGLVEEITCTGEETIGACSGQPAGTIIRGIPGAIAQSDASSLFPPEKYAAMLREWFAIARPDLSDEYGNGTPILWALAHRPATGGIEEAYQAIITGIFTNGPVGLRQARILSFQFQDGSWRLREELFATITQTATDYLSGECADCYDQWEPWEGS